MIQKILLVALLFLTGCAGPRPVATQTIRFASYNVALFRNAPGQLALDLASGTDEQIQNVAAVIRRVRPDVLALMEFDYDPSGKLIQSFQDNYLMKGEQPIEYAYAIQVPSNTGVAARADYNNDGTIALPNDAYGFGQYEGQYAFALLSRFPIEEEQIRSFQKFLWKDMPGALVPIREDGRPWYSHRAWQSFRLSSKNHFDIPLTIAKNRTIHAILAHPTPPVFDGKEDRNGRRNFDEIRLLKDYILGADYLVDDQGKAGGLPAGSSFVIMGDLNADPIDGDSYSGAINQLLDIQEINPAVTFGPLVPSSNGGKAYNQRKGDQGDPAYDTAFFGARIDYVLPSADLKVTGSGVFWPAPGEALYERVKDKAASDHLLVWVDLQL